MPETSLRTPRRAPTRKPTIGPPLPAGQPIPRGAKSRVDDRIKKRMSMRYAELVVSPTDIPPIPGLPSGSGAEEMMSLGAGMNVMDETKATGSKPPEDKRILEDERFDPDAFLKLKLANSTESELKSLQSSLCGVKEETNTELQKNVFENYAEFVLVSKEITSLEAEMMELKDLLSDYKSMPSVLHIPDPTNQSSNPNVLSAYKRSSAADLRIMYFNQMQELHAHIEGSAKFAPTTPGRHVVSEVENVQFLNAATYKAVGRVRFVILDDLVLVARRRRRKGTAGDPSGGTTVNEGKLVAERCWPLSEMLVLDTKDSPRMTNVFKIKHGKETHVYRTENPQDKKSLLSQLRHVAEELAAKKRKEREGEHERRKSMWQAGGGDRSSYANVPEWMADLATRGGKLPGDELESSAKEKSERDARWTAEWADDLTVAIALRHWDKAVALVEEGKAKLSTTPPLAHKLPPLNALLTKSLLSSLALPSIRKSTVVLLVSYLLRLKAGPAARSTLLQMRTKVIKTHLRKIRFDGEVSTYVHDLAMVYFTGIKHTADWFLASFKENEVASAFIDWAKSRVEDFADDFKKQVFTSDADPQVVSKALEITYTQSRRLLQDYGLDFRYLLEDLLVKKAKAKEDVDVPQLFFPDQTDLRMDPVPPSRRKTPAPSNTQHAPIPLALQLDTPAPLSSAASTRSITLAPPSPVASKRSGISPVGNSPLLSAASAYSTNSNYSNATAGVSNTPNVSALAAMFNRDVSQTPSSPSARPQTPSSNTPPRPRTPASALPLRPRTPVSAAPSRPRTPISATPSRSIAGLRSPVPPSSAFVAQGEMPLVSSLARRARSPPAADRERPPRSTMGSPGPPPRSTNRPGSIQQHPPVAFPSRNGMI